MAALFALQKSVPQEEVVDKDVVSVDVLDNGREAGQEVIGQWISIEDVNYVSEINGDGSYKEIYDGQIVSEGTWEILTTLENEGLGIDSTFDRQVFLKKTDGQNGEIFYYQIPEQEEDRLVLVYLFGDVLMFERAVPN